MGYLAPPRSAYEWGLVQMRTSGFVLLMFSLFGLMLTGCSSTPPMADLNPTLWQDYQHAFIRPDGRVIDVGNGGISHTEGQGYGMLLAVAANDRATFDRLWQWTRAHLSRPNDPFFSFRWDDRQSPLVSDPNNATDGELLMAWALARADRRWHVVEYRQAALILATAIRTELLRPNPIGVLLLPGMVGFEHPGYITVNPSYWIFPAFAELNRIDPSPQWDELEKSGLELLARGRFGNAGLPPDWANVTTEGKIELGAEDFSRFSFDVVRVPLYSCWGGVEDRELLEAFASQWSDPKLPAWVNLKTGQHAPYALSPTQTAMNSILLRCMGRKAAMPPEFAPRVIKDDYYASTLTLLGEIALKERRP